MVIETEMVTGHFDPVPTKLENQIPEEIQREMRPENIGRRLKLVREAHGLSPSEIADQLEIERTYWSRFEGGKRMVSDSVAALLVARFGLTLDFLILGRWESLSFEKAKKLRDFERLNS